MHHILQRRSERHSQRLVLLLVVLLLGAATPAFADATVFLGSTMTPANRVAKGVAIGVGLVVIGFEFEFSDTGESDDEPAPSLRTGQPVDSVHRAAFDKVLGPGGYRFNSPRTSWSSGQS